MRRAFLTVALLAVTVMALAGCGSSDEDEIRAVVKEFQRLSKAKDSKRACALLTPRAQAQLTALVSLLAGAQTCEQALKRGDTDDDVPPPEQVDKAKITIRDDRAITAYRKDEPVGLRKVGGEWRVDNLLNPNLDEPPRPDDPRLRRGSDEQQVRATMAALVDAFAGKDYDRGCGLLTDGAQAQLLVAGLFAQGFSGEADKRKTLASCGQVLRDLEQSGDSDDDVPSASALKAATVSIHGDRATVKIPGEDDGQLVRIDGRWLVDANEPKGPGLSITGTAPPSELRGCWQRAGADIASTASDLSFASLAESRDQAVSDGRASIKGDDWRVFYALPESGDDPGIEAVLADPGKAPVVAYIEDAPAHPDVVAKARACGS